MPSSTPRRVLQLLLPLPLLLLLAGCVSVASDPLSSPPKANESTVVLSMSNNTAQVTATETIEVERIGADNRKEKFLLRQVAPGLARDTSLFIGVLPEGNYELADFHNYKQNLHLALKQDTRNRIGQFAVQGGKNVDLGRIISTPVSGGMLVGRSRIVQSNLPMMRQFAPEHAALFPGDVASGWRAPQGKDDRIEEFALQTPVGADFPVEAADGTVYAASRLGTVLVRSRAGRWSALRSPGLESILYTTPVNLPDAKLLAVGEFRTLLKLAPGGRELTPVDPGDLPPGNLIYIGGSDKDGWYIGHVSGKKVQVFKSATLEKGHWQPVIDSKVGINSLLGALDSFWIWSTSNGLGWAESSGKFHHLDFATGNRTEHGVPNDKRMLSLTVEPDGSIGLRTSGLSALPGVGTGAHISTDNGATWKDVPSGFRGFGPPHLLKSGTIMWGGAENGRNALKVSTDFGQTWQDRSELQTGEYIQQLRSGALLKLNAGQQGIFTIEYSADEGKSWKLEFSNR